MAIIRDKKAGAPSLVGVGAIQAINVRAAPLPLNRRSTKSAKPIDVKSRENLPHAFYPPSRAHKKQVTKFTRGHAVAVHPKISAGNRRLIAIKTVNDKALADAKALAIAQQKSAAEQAAFNSRQDFINDMAARPAWSGNIKFNGQHVAVKRGLFSVGKDQYLVSRDGRAVMNKSTNILIGEIVNGVIAPPSEALKKFITDKNLGEGH